MATVTEVIENFISDYNHEIEEAIERVKAGKFKTHEEVEVLLDNWENK